MKQLALFTSSMPTPAQPAQPAQPTQPTRLPQIKLQAFEDVQGMLVAGTMALAITPASSAPSVFFIWAHVHVDAGWQCIGYTAQVNGWRPSVYPGSAYGWARRHIKQLQAAVHMQLKAITHE